MEAAIKPLVLEAVEVREFIVFAISSNTNDFGLSGMIVVSRTGEAWEIKSNELRMKKRGDIIHPEVSPKGTVHWGKLGYESPIPQPQAPQAVVDILWNTPPANW